MVSLSAVVYSVVEDEDFVTVCANLTLLASEFPTGLPSPITVDISTLDGTAGNIQKRA